MVELDVVDVVEVALVVLVDEDLWKACEHIFSSRTRYSLRCAGSAATGTGSSYILHRVNLQTVHKPVRVRECVGVVGNVVFT